MSLEGDLASVRKSILHHQQNNNSVGVEQMRRIEKQILSKMQSSKPGEDAVDRALRLTKGDAALDRATADAKAFLLNRSDELSSVGLPSSMGSRFEALEPMDHNKNVPSPLNLEFAKDGSQGSVLIGSEFQTNDVTDTRMAVPSVDVTDKSKPISLFQGTREQALKNPTPAAKEFLEVPKASEYVQKQILKRMGIPTYMNTSTDEQATDFISGGMKVDGQTHRATGWGYPKVQAYTWMDPAKPVSSDRGDQAKQVLDILRKEADATPNDNLKTIVDDIGAPGEGQLVRGPHSNAAPFRGKLYDTNRAPKDAVFGTVYDEQFHKRNSYADNVSKVPQDIFLDNVKQAQQVTENLTGEELKASLKALPNATQGGTHKPRTAVYLAPPPEISSRFRQSGEELIKKFPKVGQFLDTTKGLLKNPAVKATGLALGAIPVLGDAADAATGTIDAVTKKGDQQVRGAGNAAAGMAGLASVAAPAAAPILAPVSIGLGTGNLLADVTKERRARDKKYTANTGSIDPFIHSDTAPVTISGPSAVISETQRRRNARRSTHGVKSRPSTGAGWWNKALGALGLQ